MSITRSCSFHGMAFPDVKSSFDLDSLLFFGKMGARIRIGK